MNRFIYLCVIFISLVAVAGCAAVRTVSSEPSIKNANTKNGMFGLPGLNFQIEAHNSDASYAVLWYIVPLLPLPGRTSDHTTPSFWITLMLDPEGEEFSLDLRHITLDLRGKKYIPSSYRGPVGSYGGWRSRCDDASNSKQKSVESSGRPIPVTEWSCFLVKFDVPAPSPDQTFVIYVNGILRDGKQFSVSPLHFERTTGWRMYREL